MNMAIFYMYKHKKHSKGFSLVELSIALTIIGMIAGSAISVAINSDSYSKTVETETKLDRIEEALAGFVALNKRLPCPADGEDLQTDSNFGLEGTLVAADCVNHNFSTLEVREGVVPVRTLNLPDDFMFDGWDGRISYRVDRRFANNETTNASGCLGTAGNLCYRDATALSHLQIGYINGDFLNPIYITFSHGENSHGAFTKYGGATRINAFPTGNPYRDNSVREILNSHFDVDGSPTSYSRITWAINLSATDRYFDDIVRYKTKSQITREAGAVFYDSTCKAAADIVEAPGTNDCTGANSEAECESFATELYTRCLQ